MLMELTWSRKLAMVVVLLTLLTPVSGVASVRKALHEHDVDPQFVKEDLMEALKQSLGGHSTGGLSISQIGARLRPTFHSLPKNEHNRLDGPALRYLAHTFFVKEYGWLVRGLEPQHAPDNSDSSFPDHRKDIPSFLQSILDGKLKHEGFRLSDAVAFVSLLSSLILHEGTMRLKSAYSLNGASTKGTLNVSELETVLDSYMVMLVSEIHLNSTQHEADRTQLHDTWAQVPEMPTFVADTMRNNAFEQASRRNPFTEERFPFESATEMMMAASRNYGKVRNLQCQELKEGLTDLDTRGTGRVTLGRFYAKKAIGQWTLTESADYLRQLGVLDESAPSIGPQLIIPNYVTAVSNCDYPSEYYSICCIHECEHLINEIEDHIRAPSSHPQVILDFVANMSSASIDAPRNLSSGLVSALGQVAAKNDGMVPLHGRLFAQWMHYAFPHECPYIHTVGSIQPVKPSIFFKQHGRGTDASDDEMAKYMGLEDSEGDGDEVFMSQWTLDEEMRAEDPALRRFITDDVPMGSSAISMMKIIGFVGGPIYFSIVGVWNSLSRPVKQSIKSLLLQRTDKSAMFDDDKDHLV